MTFFVEFFHLDPFKVFYRKQISFKKNKTKNNTPSQDTVPSIILFLSYKKNKRSRWEGKRLRQSHNIPYCF